MRSERGADPAAAQKGRSRWCRVSRKPSLVLYGQVIKRTGWMPWQLEAMKDVGACDKVRGAGKQALILTFPNGETHRLGGILR